MQIRKSPLVFRELAFSSGFRDNQRSQILKIMTCKWSSYPAELFSALKIVMCPDSLPFGHCNFIWLSMTLGHVMIILRSQIFSKESRHLAVSIGYFWKYSVPWCICACLPWITTKHSIVSLLYAKMDHPYNSEVLQHEVDSTGVNRLSLVGFVAITVVSSLGNQCFSSEAQHYLVLHFRRWIILVTGWTESRLHHLCDMCAHVFAYFGLEQSHRQGRHRKLERSLIWEYFHGSFIHQTYRHMGGWKS